MQDPDENIYAYSLAGSSPQMPTVTKPNRALQDGWSVVGAGDLNVDGQTDLILNHADYGLGYWLLSGSTCTEVGPITYKGEPCVLGGTWKVVAVADFNADGQPDLLLQDENTYLGVWYLNGTEITNMALLSRTSANGPSGAADNGKWRAVGTGDFDGNGTTDILFQYDNESSLQTDGQLAVWFLDGVTVAGTAMLDPVRQADPKNRVAATGDFNRAGAVDIIFQHKDPRQGWGGALTLWSMDPQNRVRRKTETPVASNGSVQIGSRNVLGPR
jgi:hypothetical protein